MHRAISLLSRESHRAPRAEGRLALAESLNTACLQLCRARAQQIIPQLTNSCLNVVEEAVRSLAISNVKCDLTDLLAHLLCGSATAEGGGGRCETEAFDGAVLG